MDEKNRDANIKTRGESANGKEQNTSNKIWKKHENELCQTKRGS